MGLFTISLPLNFEQKCANQINNYQFHHIMKLTDQQIRALVKRFADIYEKIGVAGLAVGVFQGVPDGQFIGLACLAVSIGLTYILEYTE
mgnify:CR=1 FL=1